MTTARDPRAVVADDSHFMRSVITDMLEGGGIEVVGQARNGREAVELATELEPDVVTMDVEMPEMDGIEAVERIMAERPTSILMLSAHTEERADVTFDALDRGAVDFFRKPGGEVSMEMSRLEDQLVGIVHSVAAADPVTDAEADRADSDPLARRSIPEQPTLVVGSSTGGPTRVEQVMAKLPRAAGFRVLVVQHMPEGFTDRFADRIDSRCDYDVREATDGERIGGGDCRIAPGDSHLVVEGYRRGTLRLGLSTEPPVNSVRPAVDVTMESAASHVEDPLIGVILTGMGSDGAAGVQAVAAAGGRVLAQDEETSAVFGMPQRAIETGAVDRVLPIEEIPDGILSTAAAEVT